MFVSRLADLGLLAWLKWFLPSGIVVFRLRGLFQLGSFASGCQLFLNIRYKQMQRGFLQLCRALMLFLCRGKTGPVSQHLQRVIRKNCRTASKSSDLALSPKAGWQVCKDLHNI